MSYIRCANNPERLYIWGDIGGFLAICYKTNIYPVRLEDFEKCLKDYNRRRCIDYITPSVMVKEVGPYGKVQMDLYHYKTGEFLKSIRMWEVTWAYIARHVPQRRSKNA